MDQVIMWIMAAGALVGGLDRLFGNKFGLGKRFEQGFELLGATALSMVGIICLTPLISAGLEKAVVPLWNKIGLDPGMLGGLLAIDMGGYQLAVELAASVPIGTYAGIIVSAILGCTITFTVPVGMGMAQDEDKPLFARGILLGLGVMPVALIIGGLMCKVGFAQLIVQSLPVFLFSVLLMAGIYKFPSAMVKGFSVFAAIIRALTTIGLIAGAVKYMTGFALIPGIAPIEDAMAVVSSIGVVMLGSLTVAELLQRALKKPLEWVGRRTGMNSASITGLLMGIVSVTPALAMVRDMDKRGKVVNAAFLVCAASTLAAHMGFAFGVDASTVVPLLTAKVVGGLAGVLVALFFTRGMESEKNV